MIEEQYKEWLSEVSFAKNEFIKERTDWQAKGIIANKKKMNDKRPDEVIYRNTWDSVACEIGVANMIESSYLNEQDFNFRDPSTYAWDVYEKLLEHHIEIKWMSQESKWWSFTTGMYMKIKKNITRGYPDSIIVATHIPDIKADGSKVYPRLVINPHTFEKYIRQSKFNNYKPYYYDHMTASRDEECHIFHSDINEKNSVQ